MARKRKALFPLALFGVLLLLAFLYVSSMLLKPSELTSDNETEIESAENQTFQPPPKEFDYTPLENSTSGALPLPSGISVGGSVFIISETP